MIADALVASGRDALSYPLAAGKYLTDGQSADASEALDWSRAKVKGLDYEPGPEGLAAEREAISGIADLYDKGVFGIKAALESDLAKRAAAKWKEIPEDIRAGLEIVSGLPGMMTSPALAAVPLVGKVKKAKAIGTLWDEVTDVDEATKMARAGKHIKRDKSGKYVGAPEQIDSPQKLAALRRRIDEKVQAGAEGMGWYDEARRTYEDFAPNDPIMQSLIARGTAAYSPQASPASETGAFIAQHNAKKLTGEDVRPRTESQKRNVARAYEDPENLSPESIKLGKKTGPYADAKNPTVPEESLYKTANDIWHGRVMGYGEDFSRGFTPQEHGWLTGENLLLADRATARDLAAGVERPTEWTPRAGQAATWVAQRKQSYIDKAIATHAEKNAKRKNKLPPLDMDALEKEASAYAKSGIADATNRHSAYLTREARTGRGIGDVEMGDDEQALIDSYSNLVLSDNSRDSILDALGLYSKDAQPTRGFYQNDLGELERNPAYVNQVLASSDIKNAPRTNPADRAALDYSALVDAVIGSQQAGAHSRFFPENMGKQRVGGMNAMLLQHGGLDAAQREALEAAALKGNFSPVDYGQSTLLTRFGNEGPEAGTTGEITRALMEGGVGGKAVRGTTETGYEPTLLGPDIGTGVTTENLLKRSAESEALIPGLTARTAEAVGDKAKVRALINQAISDATGKPQREDLVKLRQILDEGDKQGRGIPALQRYVKEFGTKGLPSALVGYLGLEAAQSESGPDA